MNNLSTFAARELLLVPEQVMRKDGCASGQAVVVRDGRFVRVGPAAQVRAEFPQLRPVELPQRLLMPGLIDAHTHLTQALGKALAFGEPSEIFRRIWVPMEQTLRPEAAYVSAKLAALEALRGGFTTVVDAGTRSEEGLDGIARAAHEVGVRCVLGLTCNDIGHPAGDDAYPQLVKRAEQHLAQYEHDALVHPSLAISIPEVGSDRMLARVSALVREAGRIFQTHANEHLVAVERSLVARGLRPIELLAACDALHPSTLLAHATLLTPSELALLQRQGGAIAYNPVASAWKGNAVLDALQLQAQGVPFALGTDGTRYDAFRLLDAAESAQRYTYGIDRGDSSCGAGWTWLDHGTHRGAVACGLGAVTGAIEEGLAADFLLLDLDVPELAPSWDLSWEVVRLADRSQVEAVFVNGQLRLWQGWPTDWDARALLAQVRAIAREDIARAPIQRVHPTADEHRRRHAG
ncbi:amidohydrolase family protein [Ramlibacter sp. G-1-2-2]|uniref:Amidohydrolase family protein n=1 Tax=Ramlibacter agri TaxID=2728837 RepID=A0A848GV03_9BURK|nr:amidohydrolase family protein [Ramlibacter agri]NML42435.1 amidohydrolase family protein [Ramlibacter agri]